jgi:hypothetical protein
MRGGQHRLAGRRCQQFQHVADGQPVIGADPDTTCRRSKVK